MGRWNIGPVFGTYQPESFNDTFQAQYEPVFPVLGEQMIFMIKAMGPRRAQISFMVDALDDAGGGADPESVYEALLAAANIQIAGGGIDVQIPGWGVTGPGTAFIESVGLQRTHITASGRCVRGVISVSLLQGALAVAGSI